MSRAAGFATRVPYRPVATLLVVLTLAFAVAACVPKGKTGSAGRQPDRVASGTAQVKVALLLPFSGRYAEVGKSMETPRHMRNRTGS